MALRLNGSSSGYVELEVPADAGSHTLTLPDSGGSNGEYLQTNGSGVLSWQSIGDTGKILQVKTTQYDTATSISIPNDGHKELPFYVEITPTSASSRFIVSYQTAGELSGNDHWNMCAALGRADDSGGSFGSISWFEPASPGNRNRGLGIMAISYNGTDNSSTPEQLSVINYVDDPDTTDTLRYYPGIWSNTAYTWYVNRTVSDTDSDAYERFTSWITVMEVAD